MNSMAYDKHVIGDTIAVSSQLFHIVYGVLDRLIQGDG
jgi:hypothetical protein